VRRRVVRRSAIAWALGAWLSGLGGPDAAIGATFPAGFQESSVVSGLSSPTAVRFAGDGRVFVAEKSGIVKVFDSLTDATPTTFADLRTQVYDYWDRGLLGLELHPGFPATPYVYVLYTLDKNPANPASPIPTWNDACPTPPGPTTDGCVAAGRLSRLTASGNTMVPGSEQVLLGLRDDGSGQAWCQQFPSHSIGSIVFGSDGALFVSSGDGASFNTEDYGQLGGTLPNATTPLVPRNVCGDPPGGVGGAMTPPGAEGGALRSQSPRRSAGPVLLNGTILRVDADTGAALADNPLYASPDENARRIVAYGLRNPFRIATRPGTGEIWIGDVGYTAWEEVNRILDPRAAPRNFGWPCYEGVGRHAGYDNRNLASCESLYAAGTATAPHHAYGHVGSSSIAGLAFYDGGAYPPSYQGALFFTDYNRKLIFVMLRGGNGVPDPAAVTTFASGLSGGAVELVRGPGGDIFYVDYDGGRLQRITYGAPSASFTATPGFGPVPLAVQFDGTASSGLGLGYAWDLDGDGQFDDATGTRPTWTYTSPGSYATRLRVTDAQGATSTAGPIVVSASNTPPVPVISAPSAAVRWRVGEVLAFAGGASDAQDGVLPAARLSWRLVMQHCPSDCHEHVIQDFPGVASGSFAAPDHEYPSHLELRLTATDSGGLSSVASVSLHPATVDLTFVTDPPGLLVSFGPASGPTPFTRTVIVGSGHSLAAPGTQAARGLVQTFHAWSDGGAASHQIVAPAAPDTYLARYRAHAELGVEQGSATSAPTIGQPLAFLVTVVNAGPNPAPSVVLTDVLPQGTRFASAAGDGWSCQEAAGDVSCTMAELPVGQAPPVTVTVLAPAERAEVVNVANVRSDLTDTNPDDDAAELRVVVGLLRFHTLTPCRLLDTRETGSPLQPGAPRSLRPAGRCGIPPTARALSLNVTATEPTAAGDLRLVPSGVAPSTSTLNFGPGQTRAAQAIAALGASGELQVHTGQATGQVHLVLDVNGYFE
jgi:uncharacterized repeat protein (TIGR01451 family)